MTLPETSTSANFLLLNLYEELVGRLEDIHHVDNYIIIILSSGSLRYSVGSREAEIVRSQLEGKEGTVVRILRTPSQTDPILIDIDET